MAPSTGHVQSPVQVWQIRPYHRAQRPLAAYLPYWDPGTELQDDPEPSVEEITVELNHIVHSRMTPPHWIGTWNPLHSPTSSRTGSPLPDHGDERFPPLDPHMTYSPATGQDGDPANFPIRDVGVLNDPTRHLDDTIRANGGPPAQVPDRLHELTALRLERDRIWADVDYLDGLRRERLRPHEAAAQPESRPSPARAFFSNLATRAVAGIAGAFGYTRENTDAAPQAGSSAPAQAPAPSQPSSPTNPQHTVSDSPAQARPPSQPYSPASPPPAMNYVRTATTPTRYRRRRADAIGPQADPRAGDANPDRAQAGPSSAPHRPVRRVTPFVSENMGSANRHFFHHGHPPPASNDQQIPIQRRRSTEQETRLTDISEEARDALQAQTPLPRGTPQSFEEAEEHDDRENTRIRRPRAVGRENFAPLAGSGRFSGRASRAGRRAAPIHSVLDTMQHSARERHRLVQAAREAADTPVRARHERALREHEAQVGAELNGMMDGQPEHAIDVTLLSPPPAGASAASDPVADPLPQAPRSQAALEQNGAAQVLGAAVQAPESGRAGSEHEDSSSILSDPFADPFDGLSVRSETEPLLGARADPDAAAEQPREELQSVEDEVTRDGEGEWSYEPHWNRFWARRGW